MERKAVFRCFYYISIALTAILAVITLAGAFASYVSPGGMEGLDSPELSGSSTWLSCSTLFPFIGLALPLLLLINLAVTLYWTIRWRYWVFIPLIAIGANGAYLSRIYQFGSSSPINITPSPTSSTPSSVDATQPNRILTLATYNVNSFGNEQIGYTCKQIAAYLKSQHADILCFQEFGTNRHFTADSVKAALSDWSYSLIPYTADSIPLLQLALFSKYPIRNSQLIAYPNSRNCSFWCDLDVNGTTLRVFNNHLQTTEVTRNKKKLIKSTLASNPIAPGTSRATTDTHTPSIGTATLHLLDGLRQNFIKRATQAELLKELINASPYPTLVCGDFNSLPSSYTYATIKGTKLKDGFQTCGYGYMYTFHCFKHLLRIDYVLHSEELEGVDYFSPELEYSDHNPVVMRVKVR